ncbi:MAG: trehalose-6-phosphate synthase, partial [Nitrospira sp.]|nr:trehalose-6-phosphate synthase [Nitrospira sp.]
MRLSLRFLLPLGLALALLAYAVIPLVDALTLKWFVRDIEIRVQLIARTMEGPLSELIASQSRAKLQAYLQRIIQDERLFAVGFCDQNNQLIYKTETYPDSVPCKQAATIQTGPTAVVRLAQGAVHVAAVGLEASGRPLGRLVLLHDMSWAERRSSLTKWYLFYLFAGIGVVISLVTVLVAHLSWRGWVAGVRGMLRGEGLIGLIRDQQQKPELQPVAQDLRAMIHELQSDKRMRDERQMSWKPATLKTILRDHLA